MESGFYRFCLFLFSVVYYHNFNIEATIEIPKAPSNSVTAILVFGDSTVDPGNNNYVGTIFKGNFHPYGKDFVNQEPTGRFTNGRLTTDMIASYVGVKDYLPPYLDPSLSTEELMTGVSFASAGSGFDPLTPKITSVLDIPSQVANFREYKKRLVSAIGEQKTENHINNALFITSCGTNDFVVNYFTLPVRSKTYSVSEYQQFILQKETELLQELVDEGARRILVTDLPPMGCLPLVITLFADKPLSNRNCMDKYSSVARDFNLLLQKQLDQLQTKFATRGVKFRMNDIYTSLSNMVQGPARSGFDVVDSGCCGTGFLEATFLCNPKSYLCPDASKYVFFDSIHGTEQTYYNTFKDLRPVIDNIISA